MSEIKDLILPILQRMQGDLAELRRDMFSVRQTLSEHTQKFEELEIYTAYETGLGTRKKGRSPGDQESDQGDGGTLECH